MFPAEKQFSILEHDLVNTHRDLYTGTYAYMHTHIHTAHTDTAQGTHNTHTHTTYTHLVRRTLFHSIWRAFTQAVSAILHLWSLAGSIANTFARRRI